VLTSVEGLTRKKHVRLGVTPRVLCISCESYLSELLHEENEGELEALFGTG